MIGKVVVLIAFTRVFVTANDQ